MIKTVLLFIIIFFEGLILRSQIVISPSYEQTAKKIDKKISVISNIPDPATLGYVPADISNDRKNIKPSAEINSWLQSFVFKQFDTSTDAKAKKILWVIQDLSLGRDSIQKDVYSFVRIKADIYDNSKQNDANYQLINTFDSTWLVKNTAVDFSQMIAIAFTELYENSIKQKNSIANKRFQQIAIKLSGTRDDIIKQVQLSNSYPILQNNVYNPGIYLSFNEFKNNAPAIRDFYVTVDSINKKVNLFQILPDSSSRLIENVWGASINNELYYYTSGQLYPIEKSGNTFYVAKYLAPRTRRNQAFYWRMYVGKWQGDNNPYNDAHVLRKNVTENNVALEATHLDFDIEDFNY